MRRSSGRQPAVEILCRYYDFLADYEICRRRRNPAGAAESAEAFLGKCVGWPMPAKVGKEEKNLFSRSWKECRKHTGMSGQSVWWNG